MLCLSGFELYSRWVPLTLFHSSLLFFQLAVSLRRLMLGFLVLLVTGIVIALIVLIAVAEAGEEGDHH